MKRIISTLLVAVAVLAAWPGLASAHAALVSSTPANGAAIAFTNAPTSVTITFSEEVAKDVTTIQVTAADGTAMTDGATTINFDKPTLASVNLKPLSPGPYTVKWHAVTSDDNGQTDGTFSFTIINNTGGTTSGGTTTGGTTSGGTTLPTTGEPVAGLAGLLALGAALLLVGLGLVLRRARATQ